MNAPYFPAWRRKLAAVGRHAARCRQQSPVEIEAQCGLFLSERTLKPPEDGARRRRRVFFRASSGVSFGKYSNRARPVVRQVQAFCETEQRRFDENSSAYCQARGRLPIACLHQVLADSSQAADRLSLQGNKVREYCHETSRRRGVCKRVLLAINLSRRWRSVAIISERPPACSTIRPAAATSHR